MADNNPYDRKAYVNDPKIACKYGTKCYQKNPLHLQKYKHPPPKKTNQNETITQPRKKIKIDAETSKDIAGSEMGKDEIFTKQDTKVKNTNQNETTTQPVSEMGEDETFTKQDTKGKIDDESKMNQEKMDVDLSSGPSHTENNSEKPDLGRTAKDFSSKEFIKEKFLVCMPEDFYQFWDLCKNLKEKCPQEALKDVDLTLVGPYDVLAGKFYDIAEQPEDHYLRHWRYYYDPPECQTVLKGDDRRGYHIGYFRDSPNDLPVFLVSNCAKTDGVFKVMGDNIFAAVYLYLEDLKKTGDPFKKIHIGRIQNAISKKAGELQLSLSEKTQKMRDRDKKIVTRSFSKLGIVVPYNRKTQLGYREISVSNKELTKLLTDIQHSLPEQRQKHLSKLQDILTNVSIATDECDFGTGIELGLDILAHGVDCLNKTVAQFLATNYRLIDREGFAKIAEAHMKNRKKGTDLSIL